MLGPAATAGSRTARQGQTAQGGAGQTRPGQATPEASEHYCLAVSRLPYLSYHDLDPAHQRVWDGVIGSRGGELVNEQGGLVGPFNAFVHAPDVGRRLSSLGRVLRFGTSIERRLTEVAIITVGAHWKAEFEWWAHARMAREHGVADAVIDAIGRGEDPPFEADDERAAYVVAQQLSETGRLDQAAYDAAQQLFGDTGVVELVSLCGYYTLVSFLLGAFAVPLPPGAPLTWGSSSSEAG